jgi:predicted DNA-binding transcriptional regulator AlpA
MNGEHSRATDNGPPKRVAVGPIAPALLSDAGAAALLGIGVRTFHALRQQESFLPPPVVLGPRLLRWSRAELEAAIANMPRQTLPGSEPLQLRKSRAAKAGSTEVR